MEATNELVTLITDGLVTDVTYMDVETVAKIVEEHYKAKYGSLATFYRNRVSSLEGQLADLRLMVGDIKRKLDRIVEGNTDVRIQQF